MKKKLAVCLKERARVGCNTTKNEIETRCATLVSGVAEGGKYPHFPWSASTRRIQFQVSQTFHRNRKQVSVEGGQECTEESGPGPHADSARSREQHSSRKICEKHCKRSSEKCFQISGQKHQTKHRTGTGTTRKTTWGRRSSDKENSETEENTEEEKSELRREEKRKSLSAI